MINAELIDEGYCSISKRNSLSNCQWDCMDFSTGFDLAACGSSNQLADACEQYFGVVSDAAMLGEIEPTLFTDNCASSAGDASLYDASSVDQLHFNVPVGSSSGSTDVSRTPWQPVVPSYNQAPSGSISLHSGSSPAAPIAQQNTWYDCGAQYSHTQPHQLPQQQHSINSPVAVALPPLQGSNASSPVYNTDYIQPVPQYGWSVQQASVSTGPGPSGLQYHQFAASASTSANVSDPLAACINSPSTSQGDRVASPTSTISGTGTLQQPLSPNDERRLRNNEASRRSRLNQKNKNEELQIKLYQMELENLSLKKNIDEVTKMVKYMKEKLVDYMQSKS